MDKRSKVAVRVLAAVIVATPLLVSADRAEAAWTSWSCEYAVSGYPVSGGSLSGRGCAQWWTGAENWWQVWGDTYVPYSYQIQTYVAGEDRCGGGNWVYQMSSFKNVYNNTYGTSGDIAFGDYLTTCTTGHYYRDYYAGSRKRYSSSSWESATEYVYW